MDIAEHSTIGDNGMAITSTRLFLTGVLLLGAIAAAIFAGREWHEHQSALNAFSVAPVIQPAVWNAEEGRPAELIRGQARLSVAPPHSQMTIERLGLAPGMRAA
ncbi:hypothetical protein [Parapedomonas caeni]